MSTPDESWFGARSEEFKSVPKFTRTEWQYEFEETFSNSGYADSCIRAHNWWLAIPLPDCESNLYKIASFVIILTIIKY